MITRFLTRMLSDYYNCIKFDDCEKCKANRTIPKTPTTYCELLRKHGENAGNELRNVTDRFL